MSQPKPEKCSGRSCSGSWGATGIVPPGHHIHFGEGHTYLAHGEPSPEDLRQYLWEVFESHAKRQAELDAQYNRKLARFNTTIADVRFDVGEGRI